MKKYLLSLALFTAASPIALAQGNLEASLGYSHVDIEGINPGAITGRGTFNFTDYLAAEGEVSFGVKDDDDTVFGGRTLDLENSIGAFGVLKAPIAERVELFGRLGYHQTDFELGSGGNFETDGVAYGVGGKYFITEQFGIRGDVGRYDSDDGESDVVTLSGVLKF